MCPRRIALFEGAAAVPDLTAADHSTDRVSLTFLGPVTAQGVTASHTLRDLWRHRSLPSRVPPLFGVSLCLDLLTARQPQGSPTVPPCGSILAALSRLRCLERRRCVPVRSHTPVEQWDGGTLCFEESATCRSSPVFMRSLRRAYLLCSGTLRRNDAPHDLKQECRALVRLPRVRTNPCRSMLERCNPR